MSRGRDRAVVRLKQELGITYSQALSRVRAERERLQEERRQEQRRQDEQERQRDPNAWLTKRARALYLNQLQRDQAAALKAEREEARRQEEREQRLAPLRAWAALPVDEKRRRREENRRQRDAIEHRKAVKETHWNRKQLHERGWSDVEIHRFLGAPHETFRLPGCKHNAHFYPRELVEAHEQSADYQSFHARRMAEAETRQNRALRNRILARRRRQGYQL